MKTFFYPNLLSGISLILNYSTKSYYSWKKNVYLLGDGRLYIRLFYLFTLKNFLNNLMIYIIYDYLMNVEVIYDKKPLQRNKVYCMSRKKQILYVHNHNLIFIFTRIQKMLKWHFWKRGPRTNVLDMKSWHWLIVKEAKV